MCNYKLILECKSKLFTIPTQNCVTVNVEIIWCCTIDGEEQRLPFFGYFSIALGNLGVGNFESTFP